ncbi:hypothetical protein CSR02_08865 [Acetobacter pomorum]|uniref:Uncharacterized protein n=1 Tax=Acetobacter pomorum TaxID=65959 RepID=A0A2G4RBJ7_9PROT|nr:hypothetical protein CSR02_08865 [Acetobacter pomorum]
MARPARRAGSCTESSDDHIRTALYRTTGHDLFLVPARGILPDRTVRRGNLTEGLYIGLDYEKVYFV